VAGGGIGIPSRAGQDTKRCLSWKGKVRYPHRREQAGRPLLDTLTIIGTEGRGGVIMRNLQDVAGEYGLYDHNVTIVRAVGENVKVVRLRSVRKKGLVDD